MEGISNFQYTKNESNLMCGIALCMMLLHHFWGFPNWLDNSTKCIYLFDLNSINIERVIADSCRICVSIYAFNTGYALWKVKEKFTFSNNIKRIFRFLFSYWVVYLMFLIFGYLSEDKLPDLYNFLLNIFGIGCGPLKHVNVPFAWYVHFYVLFILITPIILYCTRGNNKIKDSAFFVLWIFLLQSCKSIDLYFFSEVVYDLFSVGLVSIAAYFISKYDLFSRIKYLKISKIWINFSLLVAILFFRYFLVHFLDRFVGHSFTFYQDCIYVPLFVYFSVNILTEFKKDSKPVVLLSKVGGLGLTMWFVHGIFFMGSNKIQWILYLPKYSVLVLIWGVVLTYFISIPIHFIQNKLMHVLTHK